MVVLLMLSAVPVPELMVLPEPVTLTVPPPVAAKALLAPVLRVSPPLKVIVAPVLLFSKISVPVSLIDPESVTVPPERFWTDTERPAVLLMLAAKLTVTLAAPLRSKSVPATLAMLTFEVTVALVMPVPLMPAPLVVPTFTPSTVTPLASVMTGQKLHEFDLDLSRYALDNIGAHLGNGAFAA